MEFRKGRCLVELTEQERESLASVVRSTTERAGLVKRARAVLLRAEGVSLREVSMRVGMRVRHVRKWQTRFRDKGIAGLNDAPRSGRPPRFSPRSCRSRGEAGLRVA